MLSPVSDIEFVFLQFAARKGTKNRVLIIQVFGILTKLKETVGQNSEVCDKLDQAICIIQGAELYTPAEISDRGSFIGKGVT